MTSRLLVDKIEGKSTSGTVQMPQGHVIQTQSSVITSEVQTSSTSYTDTGHSVTITPKFSSSKIFILFLGGRITYGTSTASRLSVQLHADSVNIAQVVEELQQGSSNVAYGFNMANSFTHSPNTTSAVVYKTVFKSIGGNAIYYNSQGVPINLIAQEIVQ